MTVLTLASRNHLDWCRRRNLAESTISTRRCVLGAVQEHCDPLAATTDDLELVLAARVHQPASRNVWISHLRSFYRWAMWFDLIDRDPTVRLVCARTVDNLPRPMPDDVLDAALAAADPIMRLWLTLGAYAGLRASEIAHLRGEHVDHRRRVLRIERSKGGRSRVVPMHDRVAVLAPRDTVGALWAVSPNNVTTRIARHLRSLGFDYTAHTLRHRFATAVYGATGDINVVRELLGHASTATTQVYVQVSGERRASAVALIA